MTGTIRQARQSGLPGPVRDVRASILDRLLEEEAPQTVADPLSQLRHSVLRNLEALLNAQPPWRSVPAHLKHLKQSGFFYGLSGLTAEALSQGQQQAVLLRDVEATIRRLEPRLAQVRVRLAGEPDRLRALLVFRIEAMLLVEPVMAPVAFDTIVDATTSAAALQLSVGNRA